jgi:formylglycine-generating enzyme required for sulfatase activity
MAIKPLVQIVLISLLLNICIASLIAQETKPVSQPNSFIEKGLEYFKNQNYKQAVVEFQEAIRLQPENAYAQYCLGLSYANLKQWSEAIEPLRKALSLEPHPQWGAVNEKMVRDALAEVEQNAGMNAQCGDALSHLRGYPVFTPWYGGNQWHILIVPHGLDSSCLIRLAATVHKGNPEDRYEFFDADGENLRKYVALQQINPAVAQEGESSSAFARGHWAASYSAKWIDSHRVATLETETEPQQCPVWVVKANLKIIVTFDRIKCPLDVGFRAESDSPITNPQVPTTIPRVRTQAGIEFVLIPAGEFMMGSDNGAPSEKPVHRVMIRQPFYIGKYEVTQRQWQEVMGNNPSAFKNCDSCPVEQVSWDDAQQFLAKLNERKDGLYYRLPSEAEWEYACRAGTIGDYAGDVDSMAWYGNNSGSSRIDADTIFLADPGQFFRRLFDNGNKTHPVGMKQPNAWGLYDMHGNAWEWCQDWFHDNYNGAPVDGSAWETGRAQDRVVRSGSSFDISLFVRSAHRYMAPPDKRSGPFGFRVVTVVPAQ